MFCTSKATLCHKNESVVAAIAELSLASGRYRSRFRDCLRFFIGSQGQSGGMDLLSASIRSLPLAVPRLLEIFYRLTGAVGWNGFVECQHPVATARGSATAPFFF
jgi:hypothetical protein